MKNLDVKEKRLNAFWIIVQAIFTLFIGVFILSKEKAFLNIFEYIFMIYFFVTGIVGLLRNVFYWKNKKKRTTAIALSIITILLSFAIYLYPGNMISTFSIIFTSYIIIVAIIKTIVLGIYLKNKIKGKFIVFIQALLAYLFSYMLTFNSHFRDNLTIRLAGIYAIALSFMYILDAIQMLIPIEYIKKLRRKINIVSPVFIASFSPRKELRKLKNKKQTNKKDILNNDTVSPINEEYKQADMEILIHINKNIKKIFGHADIFFDGKIYSYGPYDSSSNILKNLIGDGVLFETPQRQNYIDICKRYSNVTVISYGIKLDENQKRTLKETIEKIKENVYSWKCKAETGIKSRDYASIIYRATNAKFFKFKKGKFKKYLSVQTNCVLFLDRIIGSLGIGIVRFTGIITPGTYYDYFERQYNIKNSNVVFKKIYRREGEK